MTYADARTQGYKIVDKAYFRGYISRKTDLDAQPVHTAGGKRAGQLYIEAPAFNSTQYAIRYYLGKF